MKRSSRKNIEVQLNFTIRPREKTFLYLQVKEEFLRAITSGKFKKGTKLPSSYAIESKNIGRATIERAYRDLCKEGYVTHIKGEGYFVA